MKSILDKNFKIQMSDGSVWFIPVSEILVHMVENSPRDNTDIPVLFDRLSKTIKLETIIEYATNKMMWEDVKDVAVQVVAPASAANYPHDWKTPHRVEIN